MKEKEMMMRKEETVLQSFSFFLSLCLFKERIQEFELSGINEFETKGREEWKEESEVSEKVGSRIWTCSESKGLH